MARKRNKATSVRKFAEELRGLDESISDDLRLPSLTQTPPRLEGYSFKFSLLLPLMSARGTEVFTSDHLLPLYQLLCRRFGGCSVTSSTTHPALYGYYQPGLERDPERDYHTMLVVYSVPLDSANRFFAKLKAILRAAPLLPQDEILVERLDAMLL